MSWSDPEEKVTPLFGYNNYGINNGFLGRYRWVDIIWVSVSVHVLGGSGMCSGNNHGFFIFHFFSIFFLEIPAGIVTLALNFGGFHFFSYIPDL